MKKGGWDVIPEKELSAKSPRIDKDAHVEFLFRELKVDDSDASRTTFRYHNRAKIFTEAGVSKWDKIDIAYQTGWRVYSIKARVIYPDGTVAHLDSKDIYKRQIFKDDEFEGFAQSFSFPGLKPGCIVEYKWTESRRYWTPSLTIALRAEWPTWVFNVSVDPYGGMASRISRFNCGVTWDKKGGKYLLSIKDQHAVSTKPQLVARKDFEPFIYMGYASDIDMLNREEYWGYRGGGLVELNKDFVKSKQKVVKDLADRLFKDLNGDKEKMLRAAYDYCTNELTNIESYTEKYTEEEIEELKENDSPKNTINNGYGTRYDINAVFASLAAVAGFNPRLAQVENHDEFTYKEWAVGSFNLSDWAVAIESGDQWRYFDPGSSFLPYEVLNASNSDANAILTDKKFYYIVKTKAPKEGFSRTLRIADVTIDEYGDLSGSIKIRHTGYSSISRKRLFVAMTPKEREEYILENIWKNRLPRATIENFRTKYESDREGDLQLFYDIKIPGYADVAGDRLVLNPSLFEQGTLPLFRDEERVEPIGFNYHAKVQDKVTFSVPEGYQMESEKSVQSLVDGQVVTRKSIAQYDEATNTTIFQRLYELKLLKVLGQYYSIVRQEFETLNAEDAVPLSFVKGTGLAAN